MFGFLKNLFGPGTDYKGLLSKGAMIVDVRTPEEYKAGHIDGARNIPLDQIKTKVPELKKTGKPVITCCRSGSRSGMAKSQLAAAGIEVYNGGAWTSLNNKIK
jgi:phage shock protein E